MSLSRAFLIVLASGAVFGIAGALFGFTLGMLAPGLFWNVFMNQGRSNDRAAGFPFDPIEIGTSLGAASGVICGLLVGSVVILAVALAKWVPPRKGIWERE